jgi:hypothetical protein
MRDEEAAHTSPSEINIDLKFSLWSKHIEDFDERAPECAKLLRAFPESLTIHTASKIRYGTVTIECNGDEQTCTSIRAHGKFCCEWDEPGALVGDLDLDGDCISDEECQNRAENIQQAMFDLDFPPSIDFDITAPTLDSILECIDKVEDDLIEANEKAREKMEEWANSMYGSK